MIDVKQIFETVIGEVGTNVQLNESTTAMPSLAKKSLV